MGFSFILEAVDKFISVYTGKFSPRIVTPEFWTIKIIYSNFMEKG